MSEYEIVGDEPPNEIKQFRRPIYIDRNRPPIRDLSLSEYPNLEESIFINCHLQSMKVTGIEKPIRIIFINCRITGLRIEESKNINIKFINCDIYKAELINSDLPGIIFTRDRNKYVDGYVLNLLQDLEKEKKADPSSVSQFEPTINESKFIFCDLNNMLIDGTKIINSEIKHCKMKGLIITENVMLKNIDLRGTKISNSDFGGGEFNNIQFNKGFFLIEVIKFWLFFLIRLTFNFFISPILIKNKIIKSEVTAKDIKKQNWQKLPNYKRFIERKLYKCFWFAWIKDLFSATEIYEINYGNANFSIDCHFFWQIEDLNFIHRFKKKHPIASIGFFLMSNYMRSCWALLCSSLVFIGAFSLIYTKHALFHPPQQNTFLLSCKIFINIGIHPVEVLNNTANWIIIAESILGYFALGSLLSIIIFTFSRRTSMPQQRRGNKSS